MYQPPPALLLLDLQGHRHPRPPAPAAAPRQAQEEAAAVALAAAFVLAGAHEDAAVARSQQREPPRRAQEEPRQERPPSPPALQEGRCGVVFVLVGAAEEPAELPERDGGVPRARPGRADADGRRRRVERLALLDARRGRGRRVFGGLRRPPRHRPAQPLLSPPSPRHGRWRRAPFLFKGPLRLLRVPRHQRGAGVSEVPAAAGAVPLLAVRRGVHQGRQPGAAPGHPPRRVGAGAGGLGPQHRGDHLQVKLAEARPPHLPDRPHPQGAQPPAHRRALRGIPRRRPRPLPRRRSLVFLLRHRQPRRRRRQRAAALPPGRPRLRARRGRGRLPLLLRRRGRRRGQRQGVRRVRGHPARVRAVGRRAPARRAHHGQQRPRARLRGKRAGGGVAGHAGVPGDRGAGPEGPGRRRRAGGALRLGGRRGGRGQQRVRHPGGALRGQPEGHPALLRRHLPRRRGRAMTRHQLYTYHRSLCTLATLVCTTHACVLIVGLKI